MLKIKVFLLTIWYIICLSTDLKKKAEVKGEIKLKPKLEQSKFIPIIHVPVPKCSHSEPSCEQIFNPLITAVASGHQDEAPFRLRSLLWPVDSSTHTTGQMDTTLEPTSI